MQTVDEDGRTVILRAVDWGHVTHRHPYIGVERQDLLDAVARPDAHLLGREPGEEWFYRRGVGPSSWIRVVVHYKGGRGLIVTAFPRRSFP